ncbi:MAG: response regulator [Paludibacter sp.]|nr:response regulator [Paludibacter sp.]
MKYKDLKIGSQLVLGFTVMLIFVIILGVVANRQADKMHQQTEAIYNRPLQLRRAVSNIKIDILKMRLSTRDLMLASTDNESQSAIQVMEIASADVQEQFNVLNKLYTGPKSDLDQVENAFLNWKIAREANTKLALEGKIQEVKKNILPQSLVGRYRDQMLVSINRIDTYELKKGEALFANANKLKDSLNIQLLVLVCLIITLSVILISLMLRNIRRPILELTDVAKRFQEGDMSTRSRIETKNEYGTLADTFNTMVENIQINTELSQHTTELSQVMLLEEEPHKFFNSVLPVLASLTNSQLAAVYLLSENKKQFEHFESFGMSDNSKLTFKVDKLEGEFGPVITTRKIHIVKRIPKDTRFLFHTVSGKIVPREIITIPIISGKEIIAIISLASIRTYSKESPLLLKNVLDTLTARIEGVLAYQKMQVFTRQLEYQNIELEAQKIEMSAQSSELMEQNRELEMQKIQLSEASQLKTNFLSNMSHELRTPLNSVIALSGVLNRKLADKIPADEYSYLEVIERNGKHLLSLINDILDISRIESGKEEIEITKFSTNNLISEVISMIDPQARQKKIKLYMTDTEKDLIVRGDVDKCRHILQNLIGNAVKFTEKGKVAISCVHHGEKVEIEVADTGIGISEDHLDHIFDEFRQADAGTSRRFGGTGLGLAIAKKYANLLGGTITVKSKPGEGSAFTLSLPLNYAAENRIEETTTDFKIINPVLPTVPRTTDSQKTILLVEDSEPAIIQLKDFMEESGYKILTAHDGPEALGIISQVVPDAMILDLMMPGMDGFEVLQTIRDAEPTANIPVLILTAKHITKEDLRLLKRNNVHQLIQKGDVNRVELLSSVASLVHAEKIDPEYLRKEIKPIVGKPVILIVEDNSDNMLTVKAILEDSYTLLEAADGAQGIVMAKAHTPHLILMDIALPGVDGIAAFNEIRNDGHLAHIPIVALTASAMTMDRETILAYGFDGYIAKPIDDKAFYSTINKVLYGE